MSYLDDDQVVLDKGAIDLTGAKTYGKKANVPSDYVVALQKDLFRLGFTPGAADGFFGNRTTDALRDFQQAARTDLRLVDGKSTTVSPTYQGAAHGECDRETRQEIRLWPSRDYRTPRQIPPIWIGPEQPKQENGIPFAESTASELYWPIQTSDRGGREVAYRGDSGAIYGRSGRRFLADRSNGRYHVGVDLWGEAGDIIVACEDGTVVNHYHFYNNVDALFVQCTSGLVINYGEVEPDSWEEFGIKKGDSVKAGQPIARVGQMTNSAMCHFETYTKGTIQNQRYYQGQSPPSALLNPTKYLLHLAKLPTPAGVVPPLLTQTQTTPIAVTAAAPNLSDVQRDLLPNFSGLEKFHNAFPGGVRWRLTLEGIEVEGSGIERTGGDPTTATRIWEQFGDSINHWAKHFQVPCVLIIATIATETSGKPSAIRQEPGYISDEKTPGKISPGLMQTLISTARATLKDKNIDRAWLLVPANSIQAGASYIAEQSLKTMLDPPKVACAYNAGSLLENRGRDNRWKMKQFPIGTSEHCNRFVKWFNDAVAVLATHPTKPSVPYELYLL